MASAVTLSSVLKKAGEKTILNNISLSVKPGEFMTLVGPSGCGKSTLLRLIAGLTDCDCGSVNIDDRDVVQLAPRDRGVAMVFQSYALYPHMTVRENVATPLRMSRLSAIERLPWIGPLLARDKYRSIERDVTRAIESVQLNTQQDNKPSQLSGGQRQRVAIARAMVRNPGVFLMDEPLSNLDARLRVHMRGEIAKLHKSMGATIIYVTHDQTEAMTLSDRIALMMDGEIVQVGTPEELYETPRDIRVAKFIGSPEINLIEVKVNCSRVEFAGEATSLLLLRVANGSKLSIGIRPHQWLVNEQLSQADLIFSVKVEREEVLGADVLLYGHLDAQPKTPIVARFSADCVKRLRGESNHWSNLLSFGINACEMHLFDDRGSRIPCPALTILD